MIGQILNFGLPAPIDIQIVGENVQANHEFANVLLQKLHSVAGAVDLHIQQSGDYPQFNVDVDRTKAQLLGLTGAERGGQHAGVAVGQLPDSAQLLGRSPIRDSIQCGDPDSAIPPRNPQRFGEHSDQRPGGHRIAAAVERRQHSSQRRPRGGQPLQCHPGARYFRLGGRHRLGLRLFANRQDR